MPVDLDDIAERFVKRMYRAADLDNTAVDEGRPALEKQRMLAEVVDTLNKYARCGSLVLHVSGRRHFHEVMLDNGVLAATKAWLEPLTNRTLPAPNIRKALLEALRTLPVETVHLRESGVGKIVNFFGQRDGEMEDIRRAANDLVAAWSRPILARSMAREQQAAQASQPTRLQSEALRRAAGRRYSMGVESSQQRKIVQHLAKKRAKAPKF